MEDAMKMAVTCMIVDDEKPAHQVLNQYIERVPGLLSVEGAYLGLDALDKIPILKPDILFLDVQMPDLNGIRVLEILKTISASVILTSAHQQFAVDGYSFSVKGFLLKPIYFDKFLETVFRVRQQRETMQRAALLSMPGTDAELGMDLESSPDDQAKFPVFHKDCMMVKADGRIVKVPYSDVIYIEGNKNYVKIFTGDRMLNTRIPIVVMIRSLPAPLFINTHRSFIINRLAVNEIEGNEIIMDNSDRVKISSDLRALVIHKLTVNE